MSNIKRIFLLTSVSILLALTIFLFAACGSPGEATGSRRDSYTPEVYQYSYEEHAPQQIVYLSLGETFQFANFDVALGDSLEFVSYEHDKYLYIPVTIRDIRVDPPFYGESIWQLLDTQYYAPNNDEPNLTAWRAPGTDGGFTLFSWSFLGDASPVAETHIRLLYSGDGLYTLEFNFREGERLIPEFVLALDVRWPDDYTVIAIENIHMHPGEAFQLGNSQIVVGSDFTRDDDVELAIGIHLFPATFTNNGYEPENFSSLELARLNSNCGYPVDIPLVFFQDEYILPAELPTLAPGMHMDFRIPVEAFVCENTAWYRSFRITERTVDYNNNITVRHYVFDINVVEYREETT